MPHAHPHVDRKNYAALPDAVGPYSHAVKHEQTLYLSGFTAFGTAAQGGGLAEQADAVFDQIEAVAAAEGVGMRSLLKVTVFITDIGQIAQLRPVLLRRYDGNLPASSLVEVSKLFSPELNIEIEAIFAV